MKSLTIATILLTILLFEFIHSEDDEKTSTTTTQATTTAKPEKNDMIKKADKYVEDGLKFLDENQYKMNKVDQMSLEIEIAAIQLLRFKINSTSKERLLEKYNKELEEHMEKMNKLINKYSPTTTPSTTTKNDK